MTATGRVIRPQKQRAIVTFRYACFLAYTPKHVGQSIGGGGVEGGEVVQ